MDSNQFDAVLSHSVFQYFCDLGYAERVLLEMKRIANAGAVVMVADVPDAAKQDGAEAFRRQAMTTAEYERLYATCSHLYYPKRWFRQVAQRFGWNIEICDQDFGDYGNAPWRFNVTIIED